LATERGQPKLTRRIGGAPVLIAAAVFVLAAGSIALVTAVGSGLSLWVVAFVVFVLVCVLAMLFVLLITRDEERPWFDFAKEFLAGPQSVIRQNLGPTEQVVKTYRPALPAFLLRNFTELTIGLAVAILSLFVGVAVGGITGLAISIFVISTEVVIFLVKRFTEYYTLYVFTDDRVMKLSGVLKRNEASINWERVTDIAWDQSFTGRLFGFATLKVDSANEKAALKELRDIPNRGEVNQIVTGLLDLRYRAGQG
jgi:membrane protein YdbS with pleckstrin-like domain